METKYKHGPAIAAGASEVIPEYGGKSLFLLKPTNFIRKYCILITRSKAFGNFIIFLILANCGFMAIDDPLDTNPQSQKNQILALSELVFTVLFTVEMALKILAMGFIFGKGTYLRNGWNWLDFIVVALGYLSMVPGVSNLSALRTFRVLRPLRTLSSIPGMRIIVKSMIASIPPLSGVAILCLFLFFIFGIVGVQLWAGVLRGRCFFDGVVSEGDFCALQAHGVLAFGRECGTMLVGNVTVQGVCGAWQNPMHNLQSFDNIGMACLAIFTSITLEGWVDLMYQINDTFGLPYITVTYFVLLIMFGSFFLLNLALAVIDQEYSKADEENAARMAVAAATAAAALQQRTAGEGEGGGGEEGGNASPAGATAAGSDVEQKKAEGEAEGEAQAIVYCLDNALVRWCHALVSSDRFTALITALIVGNTLCLSLEHYGMSAEFARGLEYANYAFTVLFTIEMVLKLLGLGPRGYVADSFNTFDGTIVIISLVETALAFAAPAGGSGGSTGLGALRTFRLLRVFKLARSWRNLRILLNTIVLSVKDVANASFLLAVIMFIFTLLGMQLFGGKMSADKYGGTQPNAHFDNLWWSFVTVFQVLTGENWNEVLYDAMLGAGSAAAVWYFVLLNIVGNYVILNLFLAILLRNFEEDDDEEEEEEEKGKPTTATAATSRTAAVAPLPTSGAVPADDRNGPDAGGGGGGPDAAGGGSAENPPRGGGGGARVVPIGAASNGAGEEPDGDRLVLSGRSLFVLEVDNPLRLACYRLCTLRHFDNFILLLIGVSSVLLAVDEPYIQQCAELPASDPGSCASLQSTLALLDLIISMLFLGELLLKVVALGFVGGKNAYMRGGWNVLDFLIVAVSLLSMALSGQKGVKALRSLRALRALKPLRVIKRNPGMKLVVNSIFRSLPAIGNVTVVCMLFFLIFGIVGVQNWSGAMSSCNDPAITLFADCVGSYKLYGPDCALMPTPAAILSCELAPNGTSFPRVWAPANGWSYDHVGMALLTLFEVTSGEMWPNIMYDTVAAVGKEQPMVRDYSPAVAIYYIAVTIVCAFLMLNVFVGVVIDNYNKMKEEGSGSGLLTANQKLWVETMKLMLSSGPQRKLMPPSHPLRHRVFRIVTARWFELSIMGLIMANTCVLASRHYPQADSTTAVLEGINLVFTISFAVEAVLKLFALGPMQYFRGNWNRFDFILVVLSFVGMIGNLGKYATLLRMFRVARIFRLVRTSKRLLELFKTLLYSVPSLANVGAILLLVFFIYAVMGMNLFSAVKQRDLLTKDANFTSFWMSFLTLFRMSTGESYNGIMHDCMIQPPYCDPDLNCGMPEFAPFYFCSFFILSNYMLLNLLIAIILDNFGDTVKLSNATVSEEHINMFKVEWAKQDYNADTFIPASGLKRLVLDLEYPLGLKNTPGVRHEESRDRHARLMIKELAVPVHNGQIGYSDTLRLLAARAYGSQHGVEATKLPDDQMIDLQENYDRTGGRKTIKGGVGVVGIKEYEAATTIQAMYRGSKHRTELRKSGIPVQHPPPSPHKATSPGGAWGRDTLVPKAEGGSEAEVKDDLPAAQAEADADVSGARTEADAPSAPAENNVADTSVPGEVVESPDEQPAAPSTGEAKEDASKPTA